jgi:hypothetical protein
LYIMWDQDVVKILLPYALRMRSSS